MASININLDNVEPLADFGLIPVGNYTAMIIDSEIKNSKSGGKYINFKVMIIEGQYKNRLIWSMVTTENDNIQAVNIGKQTLISIMNATGVLPPLKDTAQLHNKPIIIRVSQKQDPVYGDKNEIKGWSKVESATLPPVSFSKPVETVATWKKPVLEDDDEAPF